jgi:hypothetical protein
MDQGCLSARAAAVLGMIHVLQEDEAGALLRICVVFGDKTHGSGAL